MKIRALTNEDAAYELSFHGDVITATTNKVKKLIGAPNFDDADPSEKVQREWARELEDGTPFTIYDWKEYRVYGDTRTITLHIGARTKDDSAKVVNVLKELGFKTDNVYKKFMNVQVQIS